MSHYPASQYPPALKEYSPGLYHYQCWLEIKGSEDGPEEVYADAITEALYDQEGYDSLLKVRRPKGLAQERADEIMAHQIFLYLDTADTLPAFPTVADWAAKINAPADYMEQLVAKRGLGSVIDYLPDLETATLPPFFDKAAAQIYEQMRPLNIVPGQGEKMSKKQIHQRLTALVSGFTNALAGHPHPQLAQVIADYAQTFKPKVKQYLADLKNRRAGVFDELLAEAKTRRLTKQKAVEFIVYHYLA